MKQALILLLLVATGTSLQLSAQNFEVPKSFDPQKTTDFTKYNKDVVDCVNWLENTPVDKETGKRKEANSFLINWISGSPDVSVSIKPDIVTFMEINPELLAIYMGGWARYAIQSGSYKDSLGANLAGIKTVIKVYKANSSFKKDIEVEKLIAIDKKGELEKWETEKMK